MRLFLKVLSSCFLSFFIFLAPAFALTTLKDDEARSFIGDPKGHFLSGDYRYEILNRKFRDTMHGRFSDGVVFNAQGGHFGYLKRKDGDHKIVIDAPDGREEAPVTEEAWRQRIANALTDDNTQPYVFLNDTRQEIATAYVGKGTQVSGRMNESGLLELTLTVPGAQDRQSSSRRRR